MSASIWFLYLLEKNRVYIQNNGIINSLKMKLLNQNFFRKITIAKGDRLAYLFVLNTIGKKINDVNYIKSLHIMLYKHFVTVLSPYFYS